MVNKQFSIWEHIKIFVVVFVGALLNAVALNFFLIPANVYSSGLTGASQLISNIIDDYSSYHISTGILIFLLNIPVIILGWLKIGKAFTFYSFISVLLLTIFLEFFPISGKVDDILLYGVFGGVIAAVGIGMTLRVGASTGGLDIIAMVLSRMSDKPVGIYFFMMNAVIIITAGALYGWDKALYTLVSLYASTRVIDAIHTRQQKLTALIVTKKADELKEAIYARMVRGITVLPAKGAFSREPKELMMIVITRYELYEIERIIRHVDPEAFTNIIETTDVIGFFRKE